MWFPNSTFHTTCSTQGNSQMAGRPWLRGYVGTKKEKKTGAGEKGVWGHGTPEVLKKYHVEILGFKSI